MIRRRTPVLSLCLLLVGLVGSAGDLVAQKTDQILLANGDDITGEIKGMARGQLDYSTTAMGRVQVEWWRIVRIKSDKVFEIELSNAVDYVGTIEHGENDGDMVIVTETQRTYVRLANVVSITPLGSNLWSRVDGSIDVGLDLTQANNQVIWNTHARLAYRGVKWKSIFDASSYLNSQSDRDDQLRNTVTWDLERFISDASWSIQGSIGAEQNDELSLDHRYTARLMAGNFFVRTNQTILQGFAGLATTDELFFGQEESQQNIEGVLAGNFEFFQFVRPEVDISVQANLFASASDFGRLRTDFDLNVSWEVVKDLDFGVRGYLTTDNVLSREADSAMRSDDDTSTLDYSLSMTIGYSWD